MCRIVPYDHPTSPHAALPTLRLALAAPPGRRQTVPTLQKCRVANQEGGSSGAAAREQEDEHTIKERASPMRGSVVTRGKKRYALLLDLGYSTDPATGRKKGRQ